MNQEIIDKAVNIATRNALAGMPVKRVLWIPPQTGTSNPAGMFAVEYHSDDSTPTKTLSWEQE